MTPAAAHAVLRGSGRATRLAGIFYLIHALQDLGLPDSFDPGWQANVAGPWGTVDLLARALLGSRLAEASGDPVWTALEELADWGARRSRAHGGPPASGVADPPFRVPASWRERLRDPLDRLRWASARGRLWLWSEAGYLVAHRRLRGDAAEVARREGALLAESDDKAELRLEQATSAEMPWTPPASTPARCPPRLCRWAAAVAPAVRRRLRLALGSSEDVTARLMVPGRVYVTSSHVDLVMRLDEADLAVRAAGLDRNPGWLPAYGRVVYFHFE